MSNQGVAERLAKLAEDHPTPALTSAFKEVQRLQEKLREVRVQEEAQPERSTYPPGLDGDLSFARATAAHYSNLCRQASVARALANARVNWWSLIADLLVRVQKGPPEGKGGRGHGKR